MRGAITQYMDVPQLTLYAFWIFFAGLILYLRREDKREGYPLKPDRGGRVTVQGFPAVPKPKRFLLANGKVVLVPRVEPTTSAASERSEGWAGAPLVPTGNPMLDAVGPAAYAEREDEPDAMFDGHLPRIVPLRADAEFFLAAEDPDPRGMEVFGADRRRAGTVTEAWIDRTEAIVRYLEVSVAVTAGVSTVLLPMNMLKIDKRSRSIHVRAITAAQFADVPPLRNPDQVTLREEDMIMAYYGGGTLFATPERAEPLL
jgi:photosynthetic reaction center H subunit